MFVFRECKKISCQTPSLPTISTFYSGLFCIKHLKDPYILAGRYDYTLKGDRQRLAALFTHPSYLVMRNFWLPWLLTTIFLRAHWWKKCTA